MRSWRKTLAAATLAAAALILIFNLAPGKAVVRPEIRAVEAGAVADGRININTASAETLAELDGIGGKLAERILEYREHTPFAAVEQIKEVSGIGDKLFERIKDFITA